MCAGGFEDMQLVYSSKQGVIASLAANHEEADTRIILHAADAQMSGYENTIVISKDTDVLVLLLSFCDELSNNLYMQSGTYTAPKYININKIRLSDDMSAGLLGFHALTGCDSTSKFSGIGKKSAWQVYEIYAQLLTDFGSTNIQPEGMENVETFVCKLYDKTTEETSINKVRASMFRSYKQNIDKLPPTKDALTQHLKRANHQATIWRKSLHTVQDIPNPDGNGWKETLTSLEPVLMTRQPIPPNYIEVASCGCTEQGYHCQTNHCLCKKNNLRCTTACKCKEYCENPCNR